MATFTWQSAVSGSWTTDALWAGGVAPNDAAAAVALSPAGTYTVTVPGGGSFGVASVSGASGVTLDIAGTLSIANSLAVGTVVIAPGGELSATTANAFLQVQKGTITNNGILSAAGSGTYLFLNNATLANLSGGVLSGGTYTATGQVEGGSVATIDFARSGVSTEITTLDATVVLRFVNSGLQGRNAGGSVRLLESTLATIGAAGDLHLLDGRSYAAATALSIGGRLVLGGGALSAAGGLSVAAGGTLAGFGSVGSKVAVDGTVSASGGTLALNGGVSGSGTVAIAKASTVLLPAGSYDTVFSGEGVLRATGGNLVLTAPLSGNLTFQVAQGATIDLGAAGGSALVFNGTDARVAFSGAAGFTGIIAGFQTTDVLQLKDIVASAAVATPSGDDSVLTLTTANGSVTLKLAGDYSGKSFSVTPDGGGGTDITVAGVSFAQASAIWRSATVTWGFATRNDLGGFAQFSSFVDLAAQAELATLWRAAFARWSAVSGLSFVEVADTPSPTGQPDIRVGWGNFGNPPAGEIGNAFYSFQTSTQKFIPGTIVRLQDPAVTPLVDDNGVLLYQNTVSSAYQVMLHEIGHALGLDHALAGTDPGAVMAPTASAANRDLDVSDITGIRALYGAIAAPTVATIGIASLAAQKPEGTGGSTAFTFTVSRTGDTDEAASVDYSVAGFGATPATAGDFVGGILPTGTVSFAIGEASRTLTIAVVADAVPEDVEHFLVTLANPAGPIIGSEGSAIGTILNDDYTVFGFADDLVVVAEGAGGGVTPMVFTVTRDNTGLGAVTMNYVVETPGGTLRPADAADFVGNVLPSGTVSFAADATSATITVNVVGDDAGEANENFTIRLTDNLPAVSIAAATGTILADEAIGDLATVLGAGGKAVAATPVYYSGPVTGVDKELILLSSENLSIAVGGPNWFLHSGSGDDAIAVAGGTNVLDGGTGSNFLTGASGFDTFFVDARGATLPIWSTVSSFGKGDATTFWGVSEATHTLEWFDDQGAANFKGLTLHASGVGVPTASLTLPEFSLANKDTALTVLFGFDPASSSDYMYVVAN